MIGPMYYEDYAIGEEFETPGRTLTEHDLIEFAALTGDYNPIHTDEEFSRRHSPFGKRIFHGLFGLGLVEGLKFRLAHFEGTGIASLGWEWAFTGALFIGDTARVKFKVQEKRLTKKPGRGILVEHCRLVNQHDEVVQEGTHTVMVKTKDYKD